MYVIYSQSTFLRDLCCDLGFNLLCDFGPQIAVPQLFCFADALIGCGHRSTKSHTLLIAPLRSRAPVLCSLTQSNSQVWLPHTATGWHQGNPEHTVTINSKLPQSLPQRTTDK